MDKGLERMLITADEHGNCHPLVTKGPQFETAIDNDDFRLEDMGLEEPEEGMGLWIYEAYPVVTDDESDFKNKGSVRFLTLEEWAFFKKGDLLGLAKHWTDIKSLAEVENEQEEEEHGPAEDEAQEEEEDAEEEEGNDDEDAEGEEDRESS